MTFVPSNQFPSHLPLMSAGPEDGPDHDDYGEESNP